MAVINILTFSDMNINKEYKKDNRLLIPGTSDRILSLNCCSSLIASYVQKSRKWE